MSLELKQWALLRSRVAYLIDLRDTVISFLILARVLKNVLPMRSVGSSVFLNEKDYNDNP